jgi:hypothetical protein
MTLAAGRGRTRGYLYLALSPTTDQGRWTASWDLQCIQTGGLIVPVGTITGIIGVSPSDARQHIRTVWCS